MFADYPTLGIDANALYISVGLFNTSDAFQNTSAFVIKKSALYTTPGGDISSLALITGFSNMAHCSGCDGMFAAQGADNYNSSGSDAGYFISPSLSQDNRIIIRRVTNLATTPTLGSELVVAVPQGLVFAGLSVDTADSTFNIDALEWRMLAAHLRNGHLWTSNTQFVNAAGAVTKIASGSRAAVRFYDIDVTNPSPSLVQTGTIYDSAASNPFNYWMGTVMVSGQGHAALGFSRTSGASGAANWPAAATVGRLAGDAPGSVKGRRLSTRQELPNTMDIVLKAPPAVGATIR